MLGVFDIYLSRVEMIKVNLRRVMKRRIKKLMNLYYFFDQEREILCTHYAEKVKKNKGNKKLKQTLDGFKKITPEVQIIMLTHWYVHKMAPNNLLNAIYYKASLDCERGKRGK